MGPSIMYIGYIIIVLQHTCTYYIIIIVRQIGGGAGTSSGPAARAKWEIEYYNFLSCAVYLFIILFLFFTKWKLQRRRRRYINCDRFFAAVIAQCGGGGIIWNTSRRLRHSRTRMQTGIIVVFGAKKKR